MLFNIYYIMSKGNYLRRCNGVPGQSFAFYGDGEAWASQNYDHARFIADQFGGVVDSVPVEIDPDCVLIRERGLEAL